jgi:hypothetical protein
VLLTKGYLMRHLIITAFLLFSFSACDDDKKQAIHDAEIAKEKNAALLAELKSKDEALQKARNEAKKAQEKLLLQEKAQKEAFIQEQQRKKRELLNIQKADKLSNAGISIEKSTITIDTNKTKSFFKNIGKTLETKLKKITDDIEKGKLDGNDSGVRIDQNHINIDINKTKDFLESWGKKMQSFVKEFDDMAKQIDIETK